MIRKFSAITLTVSFIAMATSGMMMFFIEKPSFTIQMHPVHKLFGLIMVVAAIVHVSLNYQALLSHIKSKTSAIYGTALVVLLVALYGVAINNKTPKDLAEKMDSIAANVESHR